MNPGTDLPRRSQMITPASNPKMMEKAAGLDCDSLIFDLEDAVAPSMKDAARANLRPVLSKLQFGEKEVGVRVNPPGTRWLLDDLLALEGLPVQTVVVPKVNRPEDVVLISGILDQLEFRGPPRGLTLQFLIESAFGLERASAIASVSPRCVSLIFGAGDFTADTGIAFTTRGLAYARERLVIAAAAAGVQALDHVHPPIADDDGLRTQAMEAREIGFAGKWAIHPRQVPIINAAFNPTAAEIDEAVRTIAAYDKALAAGEGAITVDGAMVDEAMLKIMQRRAITARRLGLWPETK